MKLRFPAITIMILSLVVSCASEEERNNATVHGKQAVTPEQRRTSFRSAVNGSIQIEDTTLAFLGGALRKHNLMGPDDLLTIDSMDVKNGCYTLLQRCHPSSKKQRPKRWLYYPKSKTLVDVENEAELALGNEGINKEDRDKMKNLVIEPMAQ